MQSHGGRRLVGGSGSRYGAFWTSEILLMIRMLMTSDQTTVWSFQRNFDNSGMGRASLCIGMAKLWMRAIHVNGNASIDW